MTCPTCHGTGKVRVQSQSTGEWETDACLDCVFIPNGLGLTAAQLQDTGEIVEVRPNFDDHWRMITRDGVAPLDFSRAVADMGWFISINPPPWEYNASPHRERLEDNAGNRVSEEQVAAVLNHVPALLCEYHALLAKYGEAQTQLVEARHAADKLRGGFFR